MKKTWSYENILYGLTLSKYAYVNTVCPSYCDTTMDLYIQAYELIRSV